jgi:hypothetical protein
MKKRAIIKAILSGSINPNSIPAIGPGRTLIQTGPETYTDSLTGENFSSDQVERMKEPFRNLPFAECKIVGTKEGLLNMDLEAHEKARIPHLTETEVNGNQYHEFRIINLPEVTKDNSLRFAIENRKR